LATFNTGFEFFAENCSIFVFIIPFKLFIFEGDVLSLLLLQPLKQNVTFLIC